MKRVLLLAAALGLMVLGWQQWPGSPQAWTEAELAVVASLSLAQLGALPPDPSNAVADDPRAAELGHALFFDRRLSANGGISCSTCHQPERFFTDGLPRGQALGQSRRNTPTLIGAAYSPWQYWDGRRDSLWAQALSPLEDPGEHGSDRRQVVDLIRRDAGYRSRYQSLFGDLPDGNEAAVIDGVFANVGKALAAYQRLLLPGTTPFDDYAAALLEGDTERQAELFSADEVVGLQLFIGEARCTECHNGPLFTNNEFHNTGVIAATGELPDKGRVVGVREVLADPFNCAGVYNDTENAGCPELDFMRTGPELLGAFRTPTLRNVALTAPYMHQGQLPTLQATLEHYNAAPDAMIGHNEAKPLNLNRSELRQVESFLLTLTAPPAVDEKWLQSPARVRASEQKPDAVARTNR